MASIGKIARRTFLIGSVAVAGGVAVGYYWYRNLYPNPLKEGLGEGEAALTPYVLITQDGVTIITPRAEMGQGVQSTLAALVAEELDVKWEDIKFTHGASDKAYYNAAVLSEGVSYPGYDESDAAEAARDQMAIPARLFGIHMTGGSTSMKDGYVKMRKAGAAARQVLLKAAAQKLDVSADVLSTDEGFVVAPDGTRIPYTDLASLAADIPPPNDPELKPQSNWKYLGKSMPRLDMVPKCTGTGDFASDIRIEGMLFATVKRNPYRNGTMRSFDASRAEAMPGVKKIVDLGDGVAVVATNTWYAMRAIETIEFEWEPQSYPPTTAGIFDQMVAAFDGDFDSQPMADEGIDELLSDGDLIESEYSVPYLAHQTMEPMSSAAWLRDGRLDVWSGTQYPTWARDLAARETGLSVKDVHVHVPYLGGGFGRRAENDAPLLAVKIAAAMEGTPISMFWTREEDVIQDYYRPMAAARLRAKMENGKPVAMDMKFVTAGSVVNDQFISRGGLPFPEMADSTIVTASWDQPYDIAHRRFTGYKADTMVPVHSWRAVGNSQNGFFHDTAIDELAHAAGADPFAFRLNLLTDEPSKKVLEELGKFSGWGRPLPEGHARGVAFVHAFGTPVGEVIEIAQTPDGLKIVSVHAVVDVGIALDPRNLEGQVMSGIIYGLSAAISGEISVKDGLVEQSNFHDQDLMRMYQTPKIQVRILENLTRVKGIGEPGLPPAAPALGNAIFSLTGMRIRDLPFANHIQFA